MKAKEEALKDFKEMIVKSWTWGLLTQKQKDNFFNKLNMSRFETKGTYKQAYKQLCDYYDMYIWGIEAQKGVY